MGQKTASSLHYNNESIMKGVERMDKSRLYYQTPYVKSFLCSVKRCEESGNGAWLAVLDQTGFYPQGGGQPWDTGTLDAIPVLSVREKGGEVLHELSSFLEPGTQARGVIDWQRRYDNMQHHTGEHIFSGLVHKTFGYDNVGFHMGAQEVTMDFNGTITQRQLEELEDAANQTVYENVPVRVLYPGEEELASLDYRSKKELTGLVRLVEIPGADLCACCGTHVVNTGEVGIIKIRGMINYKGGVRVSMLCGRRALMDYRDRLKDASMLSSLLSAKVPLVPRAVEKLKHDFQEKEMLIGRLYGQLLLQKAESQPLSGEPLVLFEEALGMVQLRQLATLLYEQKKGGVVMVCSEEESGGGYQYALGSSMKDMRTMSKAMNRRLSGKGGGSACMAQGSFKADRQSVVEVFLEEWKKLWN